MRATFYRRPGPPEVLEYGDLPEPAISDRQILVTVHAAGVNPVDWKMRRMRLRLPWQRWPMIPGSDLAGEGARGGRAGTRFRPGDAVYAMLSPFSGGACAEYAAVPDGRAARKPDRLTFVDAAAVPLAGLAALQSLRDLGRIRSGQRVLINGASGGVGSFAVQIAKVYGARQPHERRLREGPGRGPRDRLSDGGLHEVRHPLRPDLRRGRRPLIPRLPTGARANGRVRHHPTQRRDDRPDDPGNDRWRPAGQAAQRPFARRGPRRPHRLDRGGHC